MRSRRPRSALTSSLTSLARLRSLAAVSRMSATSFKRAASLVAICCMMVTQRFRSRTVAGGGVPVLDDTGVAKSSCSSSAASGPMGLLLWGTGVSARYVVNRGADGPSGGVWGAVQRTRRQIPQWTSDGQRSPLTLRWVGVFMVRLVSVGAAWCSGGDDFETCCNVASLLSLLREGPSPGSSSACLHRRASVLYLTTFSDLAHLSPLADWTRNSCRMMSSLLMLALMLFACTLLVRPAGRTTYNAYHREFLELSAREFAEGWFIQVRWI